MKVTKYIILFCCAISFTLSGCSTIKSVGSAVSSLSSVKFKLGTVNNFKINTVSISNISSVKDISVTDALKLTQSVANKQFPVQFTLNVLASNPNASTKTTIADAIISNFEWKLFIDDIETIQGNVSSPVKIPAGKATSTIPLTMQLDLYKFFGNKGYENLINLALALGGASGSSSRLKLKAKPTITIAGLPITYPNYITVVDTEFRDK